MARRPISLLAFALCIASSIVAEAANTPKIKYIRVRETSNGEYQAQVGVGGGDGAGAQGLSGYEVTLGANGRTWALKAADFARRASVETYLGEPGPKGTLLGLQLFDANGKALYTGRATLASSVLAGRWSGEYSDGKEPGFWTGSVQIHKTANPGAYGVSFTISGLNATRVASAILTSTNVTPDGKLVTSKTPIDTFTDEAIYSTPIAFDGDPTGGLFTFDAKLQDGPRVLDVTKETLEMIQLPESPCGGPGPILSVTANGSGTRSASSNTQQTQQTQLL